MPDDNLNQSYQRFQWNPGNHFWIRLRGTQGSSSVRFNGAAATVNSWSDTSLSVNVPDGATSGNVVVTVAGVQSNGVNYTVLPLAMGAVPSSGAVGSVIVISGTGFGATQGSGSVTFNGVAAGVNSWSGDEVDAVVPQSATSGTITLRTAAGLVSNGPTFTVVPAPNVSNLTPTSGTGGTAVTITGSNFGATQGTGGVTFNGSSAAVNSWADASITVSVPMGATTGDVVVTAAGGVASNGVGFTVQPAISSLSPSSGAVGSSIRFVGSGFGSGSSPGTVSFSGLDSTLITVWTPTSITAVVPAGATSGNAVLTSASGTVSNGVNFNVVPPPNVTSLVPGCGPVGSVIAISGTNFGATRFSVTFNSKFATINSWSDANIQAVVPSGATTGNVVVKAAGGVASPGVPFTVTSAPCITSLSPASGQEGSTVTIAGSNFGATQGSVTFNGIAATLIPSWSNSSIIAKVPAGATSGLLVVTAGGLQSNGVTFTVRTLVSLAVTPAAPTLFSNSAQQFTATGTLSDGTSSDYTTQATWNSSNKFVVAISNAPGGQGLASVSGAGTADVSATVGGISGTTTVTVQTATPSISGISPLIGAVGTQVIISGSGFGALQNGGTVLLGGVSQPVSSWSDAQVTVAVAPGSPSGAMQILQSGLASNSVSFTVSRPSLTSVAPASGAAGTQVTIAGSGFGDAQGTGKVWLGSVLGTVVSWSDTQIVAAVAPNAASGVVMVQQGGVQSNSVNFSVSNAVNITSVSPSSGLPGDQVTVNGTGFGAAQGSGSILLGTALGAVVSWSDNQVVARVAVGSTSGVAQIFQGGTLSNSVNFTINVPQITSVTPTSGAAGTVVTLTGSGFGTSQGSGIVWLGSTNGVVVTWSDSQVVAKVADSAVGGIARVQQSGIWSNAFAFRVPPVASISPSVTITPSIISMVVGDTRSVQVLDANSRPMTGLSWASSDTTVATLSTDDPPVITAVAPGHATISAGNSSADLTVYAGPTLPLGTVQWSVPDDGSGVSQVLPAVPSDTGVDVFGVDNSGNVQAITTDGTTAWTTSVPLDGGVFTPILLPDFQGGLVAYYFFDTSSSRIYKIDGVTGQPYPAYNATTYAAKQLGLGFPVVHTDGTIFTIDYACSPANCPGSTDSTDAAWVVGIDPSTGQAKFKVATGNFTSTFNNADTCGGTRSQGSGSNSVHNFPADLMIAGDGFAYTSFPTDDATLQEQIAPQQQFPPAAYQYFTLLGEDLGNGNVTAATADALALNDLTFPGEFNTMIQHLSEGNLTAARQDYQFLRPLFALLCNTSESHVVKIHILRVGTDGSSSDMVVKEWDYSRSKVYAPTPDNIRNFTQTQSGPNPDPQPVGMITNADSGVVLSWTTADTSYCAISTANGCSSPVNGSVENHLAFTAGTAVASDVIYSVPGATDAVEPMLQFEDGSLVARTIDQTGRLDMVAFDPSGNLKWNVPGYDPQIATAGGGVIAQHGTTFDQNGNMTGQSANTNNVYSWKGVYRLGSVDSVALPIPALALTFAAVTGGNLTGNNTAVVHHSFGLFWCGTGYAEMGLCNGGDDVGWKYVINPADFNIAEAIDFSSDHRDWVGAIEGAALSAYRKAFAKYAIIVSLATQHVSALPPFTLDADQEFTARIVGTWPVPAFALDFPQNPGNGRIYYLAAMGDAQEALGHPGGPGEPTWVDLELLYPPTTLQDSAAFLRLVEAIGTAIGNAAAHETGHYLADFIRAGPSGIGLSYMDCGLGNTQAKIEPIACEGNDNFVYNFFSGTGFPQDQSNSSATGGQFFYVDVPGHIIHWSPTNDCWLQM